MPSWDKYEVLWFNFKALHLLAWPAWTLLPPLLPLSIPLSSSSLPFIGSTSPFETSWKGTTPLVVGVLQLFENTASMLNGGGAFLEGHSFAAKGVFCITFFAVVGAVVVVKGRLFHLHVMT